MYKKNNNDFKNNNTFTREVLRNFENIKRNIKNNIYYNEMMIFDEHNRNSDSIKSAYKSF